MDLLKITSKIKEAVFIFAHPDDETMFFTPTIQMLQQNNIKIHLLCLSDGNYDGLGKLREQEFASVSRVLDVAHFEMVKDESLADGPQTWPTESVGRAVSGYISRYPKIEAVFTFDGYGVSGHPNHISVYNGVSHLKNSGKLNAKVFYLRSVSIVRKYLPPIDFMLTFIDSSFLAVNAHDPFLSLRIMRLYHSQNVWFRKLFSLFSRYSYVNDYISA